MDAYVLTPPEHHWVCPNCDQTHVTRTVEVVTPFHSCPGVGFLMAPFVQDGVRAKVERKIREDWIEREIVQTDDAGVPVMSLVTTRDDGQDCTVYAPLARSERV